MVRLGGSEPARAPSASISRSQRLRRGPPTYSPAPPSSASTRWQGMTIGRGFPSRIATISGAAVRPPQGLGKAPAGAGPAVGDLGRLLEHAAGEGVDPEAAEVELQVEAAAGAREVLREPAEDLVEEVRAVELVERHEGGALRLGRIDGDAGHRRAEQLDAQGPDRRGHQDPDGPRRALRRGIGWGCASIAEQG